MSTLKPVAVASKAIISALETGLPFLKVGGDENPIVLAKRRRGEAIDDPDCDHLFEARQNGVYRRYRTEGNGKQGWRWMFLCPASAEDVDDFLGDEIARLPFVDRESIPMDAAWQGMQWEEARKSIAAREKAVAKRTFEAAAITCATLVYTKGNEQIPEDGVPAILRKAAAKIGDESLTRAVDTAVTFIEQGDWDNARARMDELLDAREINWTRPERPANSGPGMR